MSDRDHLRWETVLDRLELDVLRAERKLADPEAPDLEPWSDPALTGPCPPDLAPRARALLARQQEVSDRLAVAALALRRQEQLAARMDRATAPGRSSVYLDVDA